MVPLDPLDSLNAEQRRAAEHVEGPLLVLAGAGSGKTRVLTTRVARLIDEHGVPPERVLAVTFTNRAAAEMRERIERLLGGPAAGLWAGTFHAFGAWLLRRHAPSIGHSRRFSIHDADESLAQVGRALDELGLDRQRWRPRAIRGRIAAAKHWLLTPDAHAAMLGADPKPLERVVRDVYAAYQSALARQDALDFEDLLMKAVELLRDEPEILERYRRRFAFILVDEYQDTNHAQYRLVQLLAAGHRNLMVVGDDDQSIYGWRGADIRNILEFEEDFEGCRTVRLEQNYRSTGRILAAANAVIAHNRKRKAKTLYTDGREGEKLLVVQASDDRTEARWIADAIEAGVASADGHRYRDFAILYRTNAQSRALEDAIRRRGMPYQIVGGVRFYERREIRDVLAYLRLISNPRDVAAFERAVRWPRRGVGEVTRGRLLAWAREADLTPVEAAGRAREAADVPAAGARGLEAFGELVGRYRSLSGEVPAAELLRRLLEELDLLQALREEGPEGEERADNVSELVGAAAEVDERGPRPRDGAAVPLTPEAELTSLDRFLQEVALVADVDRADPDADAVLLMTLHNSKGLEFPRVFLAGMEEGLCPHSRSVGSEHDLEEERRLFYVGLTRARERVVLTHAASRHRFGRRSWSAPSAFLRELPAEHVEETRAELAGSGDAAESGAPPCPFEVGDAVRHPRFGEGTVVEVHVASGDPRLAVAFEDGRTRHLILAYARLEPASG
ncbi:MAG: UvrD-helicase domain-containing protein [Candidatus Palauibacterales bacterium]|nr:UvrD-helicase domain-containing protein [Candidatus Palauibacterales bacterium]MDP2528478.1 UvrD-helicase domain-containing protein [Candidatus Palauibacterales bacterium]MDP2583001.1 UvrD-helicase domain-containing protein [Candidatus Palauibacterales bacterium]